MATQMRQAPPPPTMSTQLGMRVSPDGLLPIAVWGKLFAQADGFTPLALSMSCAVTPRHRTDRC